MGWSGKQETTRMSLYNNDNLYNRSRRMLYLLCLCRDIKLKKACLSDMQSLFFYCKDIYIFFFTIL